jgi:O-antigen biosynthesis protein
LLYPNGRLQHAGIVIGVDGHATHIERFRPPDEPVFSSALTFRSRSLLSLGACLAVEKPKFDSFNGSEAVNQPFEFSDIDLCLRLADCGWRALLELAAVLIHREAASSQELRYAGQVAYFKSRWRDRLRDDRHFHLALSLDWHTAPLG